MDEVDYLLVALMEEAGEIVQAASKCLRFGLREYNPKNGDGSPDNRTQLKREIIDLLAVFELIKDEAVLPYCTTIQMEDLIQAKKEKVKRMVAYSKSRGLVRSRT